ncbi:MAG: hypothetical protein JO053_11215 [Acidobacteria bacterium]|nr:hypothetical protein [Acidobacteriota bacterium]
MKLVTIKIIFAVVISAAGVVAACGQDTVFSDPNVEYSFLVPSTTWKEIVFPSAAQPKVEFTYGDRRDGHLSIRRLPVAKDSIMSDVIQSEADKLQLTPGYVAGKQEVFSGNLRGMVFNYEFVAAGKPMSGRFYFLKANDTTVYVLRFQGDKDKLRLIRNETDAMARSFEIKR